MSIHADTSKAQAAFQKQQRRSFISSCIVGGLFILLLALVLSLILLPPTSKEVPVIVTYQAASVDETDLDARRVVTRQQRRPSAPSSTMAKVIASSNISPTTIPVPEIEVINPSADFGDATDFGSGWGSGNDFGAGGGASFFNQNVKANRIAYVIDYSGSMSGERDKLMRQELTKSVKGLASGMQYQLIFFAGPVWTAGDKVEMQERKTAVVTSGRDKFNWAGPRGAHSWEAKGTKQTAPWIQFDDNELKKSLKHIKDTRLVYGTVWNPPLEMAFAMDPPPQVIFFMTDGIIGGDMVGNAKKLASKAKSSNIIVNTIAMMEPRAERAMMELAKGTGGKFTIIEKGGKAREVPIK